MADAISSHSHSSPWNIYAEELLHHGYGYPLWMPDPDPSVAEVEIGDVGWLHDGGFYQMFNSMRAEGEPQVRNAVPLGFEPFRPPTVAIIGPRCKITQSFLCGRSIKQVDVDVEVAASAALPSTPIGGSAGVHFGFKSTSDRGAFLVLSPPAVSRQILSKGHIINYMRAHFDHWFEFANTTIGLGLKDEEILFVSGTTKTDRWAVAAFHGESRKTEGSFAANLGSLGEASVSMSVSSETPPSRYYRTGPSRHASGAMLLSGLQPGSEASPSPCSPPEQRDQCIFMNYYRMKRRFWKPLPMRAAGARSHCSDPGSGGSEDDSDQQGALSIVDDSYVSAEECGKAKQYIDPVVSVLDYILENSEALYAAACDLDIYVLLKGSTEDIQSVLVNMQPVIEVDENGVGAIWPADSEHGMLLINRQSSRLTGPRIHGFPLSSPSCISPGQITQGPTHHSPHSRQAPSTRWASPYRYQPNNAISPSLDVPRLGFLTPTSSTSTDRTTVEVARYTRQESYVIYTDDTSTELSDPVRRKCYNCRTTDTSIWRRSSLTPGKVLCNKCGLFERMHSRPRPEQFLHKRGPMVNVNQFKQHRNMPPPPSHAAQAAAHAALAHQQQQQQQQQGRQLPSMSADMLPPHHYSHPSLSPLMATGSSDAQQQQQYQSGGGVTEVGALLNGGADAQAGGSPPQALHGIKRLGSPSCGSAGLTNPEIKAAASSIVAGKSPRRPSQRASRRIRACQSLAAGAHAVPEAQASGSILNTSRKEQGEAMDRASD